MRLKIFCEDPHKILRFVRISLSSHSAEDEPLNEPFRTRVPEVLLQAMADASEAFLRTHRLFSSKASNDQTCGGIG